MRPSHAALALSALASSAVSLSLSLPINLHLDLETSLLSLKLDPTVDPSLNLTDLVNLGQINILSSPVDTSSEQNGDGDAVTRGGRRMRAKRTLLGLDLAPEASPAINIADLLDLSKLNVLSAPVDTHSVQNGDGDEVVRGGRRRSLLNLSGSPNVSPTISLSDLLNLSKLNILSAPVDTHSVQNGDNDSVVRGGRKRAPSLLGSLSLSPTVSPSLDLASLLNLDKINVLSAPVDTHSVQNGDGDEVVRGGRMVKVRKAKREPAPSLLGSLNLSPDVSPDIDLADLLNLDTINVLSAPVDTSSVQNGDGDTVTRGGRE